MRPRIVVVGASLAGIRTVQALRREGCSDEIVLVGAEPGAESGIACDRPPLTKAFLADANATATPLITESELTALGVSLMSGRATDLDLDSRRVGLQGGERLPFDALVLATGSTPRMLPGLEPLPGASVLRTASEATAIRAACEPGARVVIVGGGFIGGEVAWTALQLGCRVTIVEPLPTLMARGLGPHLGEAFTRRHAAAGAELRMGVGVAALEGRDRVTGVRLTDGTHLASDVVVLGLGTTPATAWLEGSGLQLREGVLCDEYLAALGADRVYAVGEVARWQHPLYSEDLRVEHWTNAAESARVVAANLAGRPTAHDSLPYVWSDQLGGRLQIFGRVPPHSDVHVVHGDLNGSFVALAGADGLLQGVAGFRAARRLVSFHRMLLDGVTWREAVGAA